LLSNNGRNTVRGKDYRHAFGHIFDGLYKDYASIFKAANYPFVVNDGVAHVDGSAVFFEREIYDLDGISHSGAESARGS
jgi:hypothetical protein